MILLADREGPCQTVQMHRLIWAVPVHICPKDMFSHGATHIGTPELLIIHVTNLNKSILLHIDVSKNMLVE